MNRLLCFGMGYTARALAARLPAADWTVAGTSRDGDGGALRFNRDHAMSPSAFAGVTHILVSIPPDAAGDPVLDRHRADIAAITDRRHLAGRPAGHRRSELRWLGYLSTTGVYGNRGGGWVDESGELRPSSERSSRRGRAEQGWLGLWREHGVPVHIFRLAGIYGPGRSTFDQLRAGTAKRIERPGQVFSRIHVDDLATVLTASMARPRPSAIYNVCDDEPAPPADIVAHAAALLDLLPPPLVPFDQAGLSPMAQSFWADNKRVGNRLIKQELGVRLRYPTYREGLAAILAAGG